MRHDIKAHGLRNSLLIAIAPTATIASIAGCYECIEPQVSNLFKRETMSGEFLQINTALVAELKARAPNCPHRLEPICRALENQRDDLLAFARRLDDDLEQLTQELQIPEGLARRLLATLSRDERDPRRWTEEAAIRARLRGRYHEVQAAVAALAEGTVRASSLVENLNSRLRSYFFLRRHLGSDYLALLQFFLNHRRLERSDRPERVGKTPAELLTGHSHPHWLEMLGHKRFVRS